MKAQLGVFVFALPISVIAAACIGSDPDPVSPSGSTSSGSNDPDAATVGSCPLGCLPPAPEGWTGPSATYDGPFAKPQPPCSGNYTLAEVTTDSYELGPTPAHTCSCETAKADTARCEVRITRHDGTSCTGRELGVETHAPGTCILTSATGYGSSVTIEAPTAVGTCREAAAKSPVIPTASFARHLVACGLTQNAGCEGRPDCTATPLPLPAPFTRLCIHREGDVPCPEGLDYSKRVVVGRVEDTRGCGPCPATLESTACGPGVMVYNDESGCSGGVSGTPQKGCITISGGFPEAFQLPPPTAAFTCRTTPNPTGALAVVDPITFCCNK